jgi:hypothetical protein
MSRNFLLLTCACHTGETRWHANSSTWINNAKGCHINRPPEAKGKYERINNCFNHPDFYASGRVAGLALQQRVGLLSKRRAGPRRPDHCSPSAPGKNMTESSLATRICRPLSAREDKLTTRVSFTAILAVFVLTAWLHLGVLLLSSIFSYFALEKLGLMEPRHKWPAVT